MLSVRKVELSVLFMSNLFVTKADSEVKDLGFFLLMFAQKEPSPKLLVA